VAFRRLSPAVSCHFSARAGPRCSPCGTSSRSTPRPVG
jgi:hypothetical protein